MTARTGDCRSQSLALGIAPARRGARALSAGRHALLGRERLRANSVPVITLVGRLGRVDLERQTVSLHINANPAPSRQ